VYRDLSLVASGEALRRFEAAPRASWEALSNAFWEGRDPAPVTETNERLVEHYRRVTHAHEAYGEHTFPWDVRGDVYVRYGSPDYVSRSDDLQLEMDERVLAVKERQVNLAEMARTLTFKGQPLALGVTQGETGPDEEGFTTSYKDLTSTMGRLNPAAADESIEGESTKFTRREVRERGTDTKSLAEQQMTDTRLVSMDLWKPAYPVPKDGWWESWIYTDVGPGIEVTFIQKHAGQPFNYAEVPFGFWMSNQSFRMWQELNPKRVVATLAKQTPETYRADFQTGTLEFHLDTGQYKGEAGETVLEVYYGIPDEALTFATGVEGIPTAKARRGVAVYTQDGCRLHRSDHDLVYQATGRSPEQGSRFYAEMDRVSVPPGTYRVSAQVLDVSSGRTEVHEREVTVEPFEVDSLRLSDIQLASSIEPSAQGRFVRRGMKIVPNAAQAFVVGQPVFVFYEVYTLARDAFGSTHYRVVYELESVARISFGARILGGLGRLLGIDEKEGAVTIEYEHRGNQVDDFSYLELDLVNAKPGDQILTVRVTDMNSGQVTEGRVEFVVE
jgi:GWxTD domain-containing protein